MKDVFPALEEFIIWLGGSQAAAESPRLRRLEPARSCPAVPAGSSCPLWGPGPRQATGQRAAGGVALISFVL